MRRCVPFAFASIFALCMFAITARADGVIVNTGSPDGKIATASRPSSPGKIEIETGDDFVLTADTKITGGTFTGLIPTNLSLSDIESVTVEFYRVFPKDSTDPPGPGVLTRVNSPSDVEFNDRSSGAGTLSFSTAVLNSSFSALNSVVNGINKFPNQFTGGDGPVTGQEVMFSFMIDPDTLLADHYFLCRRWSSATETSSGCPRRSRSFRALDFLRALRTCRHRFVTRISILIGRGSERTSRIRDRSTPPLSSTE